MSKFIAWAIFGAGMFLSPNVEVGHIVREAIGLFFISVGGFIFGVISGRESKEDTQ